MLMQRRKAAGILVETEMAAHRRAIQFVVVGIGINVSMTGRWWAWPLPRCGSSLF